MAVINIKLLTEIIYDTETKLHKVISCQAVEEDYSDKPAYKPVVITKPQEVVKIEKNPEKSQESKDPYITMEGNILTFNKAAVAYMGLTPDKSTLRIKYSTDARGVTTPVIGPSELFGNSVGNKLTSKNTMSFRGLQATKLARYGKSFLLNANPDGTFSMIGNIEKDIPVQIIIPQMEKDKKLAEQEQQFVDGILGATSEFSEDFQQIEDSPVEVSIEEEKDVEDILNEMFPEDELILEFDKGNESDDSIINDFEEDFNLDLLEF